MNNFGGNVSHQTHYTQNYTETGRLGEGGFGIVVKAVHNLDKQEYAIKKVPFTGTRSKRNKYQREVVALALLEHKNIVRYYTAWIQDVSDPKDFSREGIIIDSGSETSSYGSNFGSSTGEDTVSMIIFIQMELCSSNLRTWLDDRNKEKSSLSAEDIRQSMPMMREILEGLEFLHSKNLVHRDLKPENIFLQNGQIKIGDFGLAKELRDDEQTSDSIPGSAGTSRLYAVGTAPYAAPEVSGGTLNPTSKSDIYSLGVIFFETCNCIHTRSEFYKVLTEFKEREFSAPVTWSKQAETIKSMLTGLPDKRPSAKELLSGPLFKGAQAETTQSKLTGLPDKRPSANEPLSEPLFTDAQAETTKSKLTGLPDKRPSSKEPLSERLFKDAQSEAIKNMLTGLLDKRRSLTWMLSERLLTDAKVVCGPKEAEPNAPVSSSPADGAARGRTLDKDPVSAFMEYAQAKGQTADIVVLRQSGPPHQPEFEMAAQLGERQFRSITSNKKRTGRKLAAIEALKDLKIMTT